MTETHFIRRFILIIIILQLIWLPGCCKKPVSVVPSPPLHALSTKELPEFKDDLDYEKLISGIRQSLSYLQRIPADRSFVFGEDTFDTSHMIRSLEYFLQYIQSHPSQQQLQRFIRKNYRVYRSIGRKSTESVMFTGYYEPLLQGSLVPSEIYQYPVFAPPGDLVKIDLGLFAESFKGKKIIGRLSNQTVVPYYSRKEIASLNVLNQYEQPLLWVDDPIDLFFLQIQGSGKVKLANGRTVNIHYAGTNGHPYRSIGKLLINSNKITKEKMSMQAIRAYLNHHPDEVENILNHNPSYVFFQFEEEGPIGCLNVPLTAERSIATDRRIFPPAGLFYIQTQKPVVNDSGNIQNWIDFGRFVLNQDTGGAIRGPGRADLFCGHGDYAEIAAGHLKHPGSLYALVLKP